MDYLPVFFSLKGRDCLVVGGGNVARRKVELLLRAGGRVIVVAPRVEPTLAEMAREGRLTHLEGVFTPAMLEGKTLVVSATEKKEVNRQVATAAAQYRVPINVVDDPELCSFILPAIVDRSPVLVAVSSGGNSPVLARLLKARLESLVPVAYGKLAQLAGEFRGQVKALLPQPEARRKFWERSFQGEVARLYLSGKETEARGALERALELESTSGIAPGRVSFLAVHPRDPELLTLKGLRSLQEADVIVHDPDVPGETLDMARRDAERILVGHEAGKLSHPVAELPALLVRLTQAGRHVVRVWCGGSSPAQPRAEETAALEHNGIDFRVLPGAPGALD